MRAMLLLGTKKGAFILDGDQGRRADVATTVPAGSMVHIIPAVSGGGGPGG